MAHDSRWARAPAARHPRSAGTAVRRAWRRRSRKAQVSAVATILGLLLVVTVIANYLATTLPNTMGQNDLQHEMLVENQVAVLSARVEATALANAVGAPVSQPVTLGSQGAPPFADSDGGYLTALSSVTNTTGNYPRSAVNFTLLSRGVQVVFSQAGTSGFVVHLQNTYAPAAEVAYDEGAVVFAQPGGLPIFIVPPSITLSSGVLTVFLPWFTNNVNGEAGIGTADMSFRLLSTTSLTVPSTTFSFVSGSHVTINITSQYAAAWYSFFLTSSSFHSYVSCTGSNLVCTKTYSPVGVAPLGTVTLSIPTSGLTLNLVTALYSVTVL